MSVSAATDINVNVIFADSERKRSIRRWTDAEDVILRKAVDMHGGRHWKAVAACLQDRTDIQCLHRWQKVLKPGLIKGPWTAEEDAQLIKLVAEQGAQNWSKIAKYIQGRTGKQLSERWTNHLDPNVRKSTEEKWTEEEDNLIFKWHKELGNQWAQIAKYLPGRSENSVKNRFYSAMRRKKPRIYKVPTSTVAVQDSTVLQSQIGSDIGSILHQEHPAKRQRVDSDSSASMLSSSSGSPRLGSLASAVSDIPESSNPTPVSSASLFNPELMKLQEQVLRLQQAVIARDSLLNQVIMRVNSASALEPSAHVFHSLMTQQAISSMNQQVMSSMNQLPQPLYPAMPNYPSPYPFLLLSDATVPNVLSPILSENGSSPSSVCTSYHSDLKETSPSSASDSAECISGPSPSSAFSAFRKPKSF